MKKLVSILVILVLVVSMLAGCEAAGSAPATAAAGSEAVAEPKVKFKLGWAETAERTGHPLSQAAYTFKEEVEKLSRQQLARDRGHDSDDGQGKRLGSQHAAGMGRHAAI